jgi:hypothetical protein
VKAVIASGTSTSDSSRLRAVTTISASGTEERSRSTWLGAVSPVPDGAGSLLCASAPELMHIASKLAPIFSECAFIRIPPKCDVASAI